MGMLEYTEFERLVRDALADLYDWAALETHPLTSLFVKPAEQQGSRGEFLHAVLLAAIESLRPTGRGSSPASTEWRPYQILYARYVEGLSLSAVEARLALSSRQLRREHGRAP